MNRWAIIDKDNIEVWNLGWYPDTTTKKEIEELTNLNNDEQIVVVETNFNR